MQNLITIAKALNGGVQGRSILCPGPGHSKGDRSLKIIFPNNAPDGFLVHSFANDDWKDCRDHVKSHLGIYDGNRRSFRIDHNSNRNKLDNTRYAERIWKESVPYIDTE